MQALDQGNLSRAEEASAQFDAGLWRISNRLKDEEDAEAKEKEKDKNKKAADAAPPKLQVMPDALPNPLVRNLSVMSLELRAGLLVAKKLNDDAKKLYSEAAQEEKALGYHEPPAYIRPVGETEAAAFLVISNSTEAKAAYQQALRRASTLRLSALRDCPGQRAGWRRRGGHGRIRGLPGGVEIRRFRSSADWFTRVPTWLLTPRSRPASKRSQCRAPPRTNSAIPNFTPRRTFPLARFANCVYPVASLVAFTLFHPYVCEECA